MQEVLTAQALCKTFRLSKKQQQIEKTEKTEGPNIAPDGHGGGNTHFGSRRRKRPPLHEAEDEEPRASSSPLVGNLLNVKV